MEAMVQACLPGEELAGLVEPVGVIASRPEAGGIGKAVRLGIRVAVIPRSEYPQGDAGTDPYGEALLEKLRKFAPDIVTLNGFLVKVSSVVITAYEQHIFNQHPGPVPELGGEGMYGRRVHAAVLIFSRLTRRTDPHTVVVAQRVDPQYDRGPVVGSAGVTIKRSDTVESLAARALPEEHAVQIRLLRDAANGVISEKSVRPLAGPGEQVILYLSREAGKVLYPYG